MVVKLNTDKQQLAIELSKLKKEVNTLMLVPGPGSSGDHIKHTEGDSSNEQYRLTYRQRLLEGEKALASINTTKKDTNLLGAKLQEMYLRNEQLSAKLNERNSHLLEAKKLIESREKMIDDMVKESDSFKVRCE